MTLLNKDSLHIWHPFRQEGNDLPLLPIIRGKGSILYAEDGREFIDMVSSWWVTTHGHAHPKIAQAIFEQACTIEQTLFADTTHPTAVELTVNLTPLLPSNLVRFFYSDNGSTAVEVALKMSYQYWVNKGQPHKCRFMALNGGYHGDTFGAMAVGKSSGFYKPFEKFLFHVDSFPYPYTWMDDLEVEENEAKSLSQVESYLKQFAHETAAFIIEPLIQGASGMRFCRPVFLDKLLDKVRSYGILIIFDEVMTGFGRTGSLFASGKINIKPDLICLSKGLTAGFLPLTLTITSEEIYQAFSGKTFDKAFAHGHSFSANPLGCAAALASLRLFEEENTLERIQEIEKIHFAQMDLIREHPLVTKPRVMGSIAAFNIDGTTDGYFSTIAPVIKKLFFERGLFLRPLGNVVYLIPPYCTTDEQIIYAYKNIKEVLDIL